MAYSKFRSESVSAFEEAKMVSTENFFRIRCFRADLGSTAEVSGSFVLNSTN